MLADCPHIHCPELVFTVMFLFFKNRPVILWPSKICLYSVTFFKIKSLPSDVGPHYAQACLTLHLRFLITTALNKHSCILVTIRSDTVDW